MQSKNNSFKLFTVIVILMCTLWSEAQIKTPYLISTTGNFSNGVIGHSNTILFQKNDCLSFNNGVELLKYNSAKTFIAVCQEKPPKVNEYSFIAYPNPFRTTIILKSTMFFEYYISPKVSISIFDMYGRTLQTIETTLDMLDKGLTITPKITSTGIYFFKITGNNLQSSSVKIIKVN